MDRFQGEAEQVLGEKKIQPLKQNVAQTLNSRGGRKCGTRKEKVEENNGWCHKASDLGSRQLHMGRKVQHQGAERISVLMATWAGSLRHQELFLVHRNPSQHCSCMERNQPAIPAARGHVQAGNVMLSLTTLQRKNYFGALSQSSSIPNQ